MLVARLAINIQNLLGFYGIQSGRHYTLRTDMEQSAKGFLKSSEIQAVIIRADGSREDLGTIAYWHRNPLKRIWFYFKKFLGD